MTKRTSYIAAAALTIAGTIGMAGWLSTNADGRSPEPTFAQAARPGVAETEAELPVAPAPDAPAPVFEAAAPAPALAAPPAPVAPRRTERARTPVDTRTPQRSAPAAPAHEPEPEPELEPRTEPAERPEPVERAEPRYLEVSVPAGTILGVRLSTAVSSETAEIEDRVEATVTRDVIAGGRVAIPAGTTVLGSVNEVTRGGKFKERARIGVRFHTLVLADGARETVRVDAIVREGDSPTRETAAKIGAGAVGGAIIGGIMGGKKGAILGGAAGAGAGTAAVAAGDRSIAAIAAGSPLSVRLGAPVRVTIERN